MQVMHDNVHQHYPPYGRSRGCGRGLGRGRGREVRGPDRGCIYTQRNGGTY